LCPLIIIGQNLFFATSGVQVDIWDESRSEPKQSFQWGADSIHHVRFNPVETNILASCSSDRGITLYDLRSNVPLKKLIMDLRANALSWNPMEAFNFSTANEDHNCYTWDMRKLDKALNIHEGHMGAVMDIDYSPTGREFVCGSYDRTIRIFGILEGHSRVVYHTKRMQKVFAVKFSSDSKFVISGSDDTNVRLWKSDPSEQLQVLLPREKRKVNYQNKLISRYSNFPEIRRINRHQHVPKFILNASRQKQIIKQSIKRKEQNLRKHSSAGKVPYVPERKKT